MKLLTIAPIAVTVEVDATDCLVLADALAASINYDACPDHSLVNALRAALEGFAVLAAIDTLRDNQTPEREMLVDTRRVWAKPRPDLPGTYLHSPLAAPYDGRSPV